MGKETPDQHQADRSNVLNLDKSLPPLYFVIKVHDTSSTHRHSHISRKPTTTFCPSSSVSASTSDIVASEPSVFAAHV